MVRVAVIGAYGSAGSSGAESLLEAADAGRLDDLDLVLIDDGDPPGGLCILRGCMPSKDVLSAGGHRYQAGHDDRLDGTPSVDPERVVRRKDEHVERFVHHRRERVEQMAERDDVKLIRDTARFVDETTLVVDGETIPVDFTIVATGSTPRSPDIPGIDAVDPKTSSDLLDMTILPDSAVVLGLGYIGLELVPYLREVSDTDVVAIDRNERPLSDADPSFGDAVLELYRSEFDVTVETAAEARRVAVTGAGVAVTYVDADGIERTVEGDDLFTFTGRVPSVRGLHLEAAGIDTAPGWVDDALRADGSDRVFVVGDANGREPLLHVAKEEGITAAENVVTAVRGGALHRYNPIVHRIVFTGLGLYPYARVGHTAASARAAGFDVVVSERSASDDGIFVTKNVPHGHAKLAVNAADGRVLGYEGFHYHADVFAKTMQVIIENELPVEAIPDRAYHPTTPELLDGLIREAETAVKPTTTA